jgi:periplasmic protein TonB
MLKQRGQQLSAAIDARLDNLAAVAPPPFFLKVQRTMALPVPMQSSLLFSVGFHFLVIIGLGFVVNPINLSPPHNVLDVVLVNSKSASRPEKADALAQANLDGGGNTDERLRAKTPFPNIEQRASSDDARLAQERVKQLEQQREQLMTQMSARVKVAQGEIAQQPAGTPDPAVTQDLLQKQAEIERLEGEISRQHQAYQQRPRKKFFGARVSEYRFAPYVDNWRQKIERVGNINYPEEAKRKKLYGSLQLTVEIKSDGDVGEVSVSRSSGSRILDDAAKRIVRLAAPYDRFPAEIRKDTDIISITRTWTFTKDDQLLSE